MGHHSSQPLSRGAGGNITLTFDQADDASRAGDAHAFLHQCWPCGRRHKSKNEARVDEIKGIIGKVKRPQHVHDPEGDIARTLHLCYARAYSIIVRLISMPTTSISGWVTATA